MVCIQLPVVPTGHVMVWVVGTGVVPHVADNGTVTVCAGIEMVVPVGVVVTVIGILTTVDAAAEAAMRLKSAMIFICLPPLPPRSPPSVRLPPNHRFR